MLNASAVKVVDMMLRPAMPGTMMFSSFWLLEARPPIKASRISGSRKLKNAAEGLRQNIRRSSRYWRQVSATPLSIVGQLEVDVLQRGPCDGQLAQALAARQRRRGELVEQRRRVVGLALLDGAGAVAPGHAVAARVARAELAGRPLGEDATVLDDRHAVGERLGLLEVVRGEQHGLAEVPERAHGVPRRPPRGRVEAGGRLVEEDQLRIGHQGQRQVEAAQRAARQATGPDVQ